MKLITTLFIALFFIACNNAPKEQVVNHPKSDCESTKIFKFNVQNMSIAEGTRFVVTVNVPNSLEISKTELQKELKCIALDVMYDKKPDVLQMNVFRADDKFYKTFKGDNYIGGVTYAPEGDWTNFNTKLPYKFVFTGSTISNE